MSNNLENTLNVRKCEKLVNSMYNIRRLLCKEKVYLLSQEE